MKSDFSGFYHEKTYIAMDSDLLLCFAEMYRIKNCYGKIEKYNFSKKYFAIQNHFEEISFVFNLIMEGKLTPVITNTIFQEISGSIYHSSYCSSESILNFLVKFCYTPKYNLLLANRERDKIQVLAKAYCLHYYDKEKNKCQAPMKFQYDAYSNTIKPQNDATAMAEASVMNLSFLTYNGKDFVWNVKDSEHNCRTKGITAINVKNNYFTQGVLGNKFVPKPIYLVHFVEQIKECNGGINYYNISAPDEKKLSQLSSYIDVDEYKAELEKNDEYCI